VGSTDSVDEEREIEDVWRETKVRARTREVLRADANCFAVPRIVPHANVTSFVHVCESALAKASRPCVKSWFHCCAPHERDARLERSVRAPKNHAALAWQRGISRFFR
jgi:hypothetical protein